MLTKSEETHRGLRYPWGRRTAIATGQPVEVADGVHWVRFALPMTLDHINLWLLEDDDGFTVVDTCFDTPQAREVWESVLSGYMKGKPIRRVICTHLHPDHVGLAGFLTERFQCELWMSREEYLMCRSLAADTGRAAPDAAIAFYKAAGYDDEQLELYRARFGSFGRVISPLPDSYRRLVDGETIRIGGRYFQVLVGSGHSPEHVSLYCPALKLLIAGDQVLPRITPNVSLFPTEPHGDPLREWLCSCARLRELLPDDLLVLPAHQEPFYGLHVRLTQIIEGHERQLDRLFDHLTEPRRAVDCFSALFEREIDRGLYGLATGETLAHLNCLLGRRRLQRRRDEHGVDWYRQKPETSHVD